MIQADDGCNEHPSSTNSAFSGHFPQIRLLFELIVGKVQVSMYPTYIADGMISSLPFLFQLLPFRKHPMSSFVALSPCAESIRQQRIRKGHGGVNR